MASRCRSVRCSRTSSPRSKTCRFPSSPWQFSIGWPLIARRPSPRSRSRAPPDGFRTSSCGASCVKRGVTHVQQMIVSIGLALAAVNFLQWWIGGRPLRSHHERSRFEARLRHLRDGEHHHLLDHYLERRLLGVGYFLQRTRLGRATRAVSDNPALAATSGIKVESIIRLVWILADLARGSRRHPAGPVRPRRQVRRRRPLAAADVCRGDARGLGHASARSSGLS